MGKPFKFLGPPCVLQMIFEKNPQRPGNKYPRLKIAQGELDSLGQYPIFFSDQVMYLHMILALIVF